METDHGKENGNYYRKGFRIWGLGLRVYLGIMERKWKLYQGYRCYIGIMGLHCGYSGIMK